MLRQIALRYRETIICYAEELIEEDKIGYRVYFGVQELRWTVSNGAP
jgi:hypothetical protein